MVSASTSRQQKQQAADAAKRLKVRAAALQRMVQASHNLVERANSGLPLHQGRRDHTLEGLNAAALAHHFQRHRRSGSTSSSSGSSGGASDAEDEFEEDMMQYAPPPLSPTAEAMKRSRMLELFVEERPNPSTGMRLRPRSSQPVSRRRRRSRRRRAAPTAKEDGQNPHHADEDDDDDEGDEYLLEYLEDPNNDELRHILVQRDEAAAAEEAAKAKSEEALPAALVQEPSAPNVTAFDESDSDLTATDEEETKDYFNCAPLLYFKSPSRALQHRYRHRSPSASSIFAVADPELLAAANSTSARQTEAGNSDSSIHPLDRPQLQESSSCHSKKLCRTVSEGEEGEALLQARIELATVTLDRALRTKNGRRILRREARRKFHRSKSRARQAMLTYVKIAVTKAFSPHQAGREYDRRYKKPKYVVRR